jgi:uncharacterized protein
VNKLRNFFSCIILLTWFIFCGFSVPNPSSEFYINDFADILTQDLKNFIYQKSLTLYNKTTAQAVVVTVNSLEGASIDDYALKLARDWKIGTAEKNNGLLILLSTTERKIKCEVGSGLEGRLNDGKVGRFIDEYAQNDFKNNDFNSGIKKLYSALVNEIYEEYGQTAPNSSIKSYSQNKYNKGRLPILFFLLLFFFFLLPMILSKKGRFRGGNTSLNSIFWIFINLFLSGRGGRGGRFGGGFGGGSGGGFGGSSGGGGNFSGGGSSRDF